MGEGRCAGEGRRAWAKGGAEERTGLVREGAGGGRVLVVATGGEVTVELPSVTIAQRDRRGTGAEQVRGTCAWRRCLRPLAVLVRPPRRDGLSVPLLGADLLVLRGALDDRLNLQRRCDEDATQRCDADVTQRCDADVTQRCDAEM